MSKNKQLLIYVFVFTVMITAGCNQTDNTSDDVRNQTEERQQMNDELDPGKKSTPSNPSGDDKLGYVHYTKEQVDNVNDEDKDTIDIDRTTLANMITRIILENEGFKEAATLVTDDKTLIAYGKEDRLEDEKAAEMVNKTAVSILPGYFDLYISDNDALISDIQSLHNSRIQDDDYEQTIDQIIERMQDSPQGSDEK